jgi:hypothetical protein
MPRTELQKDEHMKTIFKIRTLTCLALTVGHFCLRGALMHLTLILILPTCPQE